MVLSISKRSYVYGQNLDYLILEMARNKKNALEAITDYDHTEDWFYEGNISRKIALYLLAKGYEITKDNSDNCRARGEDIIAVLPDGTTDVIEVKGYPTQYHTKGPEKGHPKKTDPKLQAKHWFSEAIVASLFNYEKAQNPKTVRLGIGLPDHPRYRDLTARIRKYFSHHKLPLNIYFVNENGTVTVMDIGAVE